MIRLSSVGIAALWIAGLGIVFATVSYATWLAGEERQRVGAVLRMPAQRLALELGFVLVCLGLFLTAHSLWERAVWVALASLNGAYAVKEWRVWRRDGKLDE